METISLNENACVVFSGSKCMCTRSQNVLDEFVKTGFTTWADFIVASYSVANNALSNKNRFNVIGQGEIYMTKHMQLPYAHF
jgi:hypothetical protein